MTLVSDDLSAFNPTINSFSTEQGFRGLLAWQLLENETGLKLYDFSEKEMDEANATLEKVEEDEDDDRRPSGGSGRPSKGNIQIAGVATTVTKPVEITPAETQTEENTASFEDVKNDAWYYDAVSYVSKNKLMSGTDKGFEPDTNMTRAMLVTVLYRIEGSPEIISGNEFSDVVLGAWYKDAVLWAKENGIVMGVSKTEFAPDANITREQLAAIMYRYAGFKGVDVSERADVSAFGDKEQISDWAMDSVMWANASGLVNGVGESLLSPKGFATRAQTAQILMRFDSIR